MQDTEIHPVAKAIATVTAIAISLLALWFTVIAFIGGTMPIIGIETDGGIGYGLFWLFIVDPIVMTVGYWVGMVITVPIAMALSRNS